MLQNDTWSSKYINKSCVVCWHRKYVIHSKNWTSKFMRKQQSLKSNNNLKDSFFFFLMLVCELKERRFKCRTGVKRAANRTFEALLACAAWLLSWCVQLIRPPSSRFKCGTIYFHQPMHHSVAACDQNCEKGVTGSGKELWRCDLGRKGFSEIYPDLFWQLKKCHTPHHTTDKYITL